MVKPILKKRSHSEKNSLDLDRPWEEQHVPGMAGLVSGYDAAAMARSARDVNFTLADTAVFAAKPRYGHGRSHSGASHASIATSASGGASRSGTFVHPFQQTPRTQTPPLTYAGVGTALASFDAGGGGGGGGGSGGSGGGNMMRDYSPTITEHDDDDLDGHAAVNGNGINDDISSPIGSLPTPRYHHHGHAASVSQPSFRRTGVPGKRAASFSDMGGASALRLNTGRSVPMGSRRGLGGSSLSSSLSQSDLHLNTSGSGGNGNGSAVVDSPLSAGGSVGGGAGVGASLSASLSSAPLSPFRSSVDSIGFPRLRSRSELDGSARADQIREARRKFEERERAKAEKHDREMLRKRERRDYREAKVMERQAAAQLRKNSGGGGRGSSFDISRPSLSRKTTPTFGSSSNIGVFGGGNGSAGGGNEARRNSDRFRRQSTSASASASASALASASRSADAEKGLAFKSSNYDHVAGGTMPSFGPSVDAVAFRNARRSKTTKRKTQGYWNGFVLWLRTRLFRMSRG